MKAVCTHLRAASRLALVATTRSPAVSASLPVSCAAALSSTADSTKDLRNNADSKNNVQPLQKLLLYGANTDVGKTLAAAGLCHAAMCQGHDVTYIKPIQTGADLDAHAVTRHCIGSSTGSSLITQTLFQYDAPESPASAARKEGKTAGDHEVRQALSDALSQTSTTGCGLCVIETAGGPLSPAPSDTPQADVYSPLCLPAVLVGDPNLGGISATLCAAEAMDARGQTAAAVLFIGSSSEDGNASAVRAAFALAGRTVPVIGVRKPPPKPAPLSDWLQNDSVVAAFDEVLKAVEGNTKGKSKGVEDYVKFDQQHLWHPYTSMAQPRKVWPVRCASGCHIELEDGRHLIDGMASWWCAVHGYNVPELNAAAKSQLAAMSHVMFGGLTHRPAADLGRMLVECAPEGMSQVFLCDSGSISVEVAMKMALQYWSMKGQTQKNRFATVKRGYHGDTFGAMAVCDPERGMHGLFRGVLPEHLFAEPPASVSQDGSCQGGNDGFDSMENLLRINAQEVAAVILEPIVQGAGGMRIYSPSYLTKLRVLCDELNILLIFDEIATGFGRTGRLFASEHAGIAPDIMCVGKALTGGYCTLAATLTTDKVARGVSGDGDQPLMHGPTYMGNPLACAIGCASIKLLLESPWQDRVAAIERQLREELRPLRQLQGVADVRALGAIGVVELKALPKDPGALQAALVERGVWLRPFGTLIYCMPPYIISTEQLSCLTAAIFDVVSTGIELCDE